MITGSISKDKHNPLRGTDDTSASMLSIPDRTISESLQKFGSRCRNETGLDRVVLDLHFGGNASTGSHAPT